MRLTNIVWTTAHHCRRDPSDRRSFDREPRAQAPVAPSPEAKAGKAAQIARGKYLVDIMGCHDCHTPMKMGPNGPEWDMTRALSGHPEELVMPPAPALPPGPWVASIAAHLHRVRMARGARASRAT